MNYKIILFYFFTAITCAVPTTDVSAQIDCTSITGDTANFGDTCTYTCEDGYGDSNGGTGTITCGDKDGTSVGEFDGPLCEGKIIFHIFCIFIDSTNISLRY